MRALIFILLAVIIAVLAWFYNDKGRMPESVDEIRAEMPDVSVEQQSTTIDVPTDIDVERVEGETLPNVDVTTEEREIEYPTLKVEDGTSGETNEIEPVNEEPNDPVPPITDVDVDEDGDVTITQPAQ